LRLCLGKVYGAGVNPGWRVGLQAGQAETQFTQRSRKSLRRELGGATGGPGALTGEDASAQESAGCQHGRPPGVEPAGVGSHALQAFAFYDQPLDAGLLQVQVGRLLQCELHGQRVEPLVALRPPRLHGRPLAEVEPAYLDEVAIHGAGHLAAQGVDLPHQVALAWATHGWVAAHLGDEVQVHGQQQRSRAHARRCQGRLAPGVPRADDDYVVHGSS